MAFDNLQAEALESLLSFTESLEQAKLRSAIDQPAAHYQHGVGGKERLGRVK